MSNVNQVSPPLPTLGATQLTATMFELHHAGLLRFAQRIGRDPEGAEDLVQDAFLRLLVEVEAGRTPDNIGAWLHRVVTNAAISRARRAIVFRKFASLLVVRDGPARPELRTS